MKIELSGEQERWVAEAVASGRFAGPQDAITFAIRETKLAELRRTIEASIAEGGEYSMEDVEADLAKDAEALAAEGY